MPTRAERFIGRDAELRRFDQALTDARAGTPSALVLIGEAGVGKSRLVAQFAARATDAGALVMQGNCLQLSEAAVPYAPVVEMVRTLVRDLGVDDVRELLGAGYGAVGTLLPELERPGDTLGE